jgi:hypothetical protein
LPFMPRGGLALVARLAFLGGVRAKRLSGLTMRLCVARVALVRQCRVYPGSIFSIMTCQADLAGLPDFVPLGSWGLGFRDCQGGFGSEVLMAVRITLCLKAVDVWNAIRHSSYG